MKVALVTHHTPKIEFACKPLQDNKSLYAQRWGMDYFCHADIHPDWQHVPAQYSKILYVRDLLNRGYDIVVWADADIAFTNFTESITTLLPEDCYLAGAREVGKPHPKYICAGLLVFRNCEQSIALLNHCAALVDSGKHTMIVSKQEQYDMNNFLQERDYTGVRACAEDEIGGVWEEVKPGSNLRGWRYGDLHIHCSLLPWEARGAIYMSKYARQIVMDKQQIVARNTMLNGIGGIKEAADQLKKSDASKIKLYIGVPTHGGNVSIIFTSALAKLTCVLQDNGIDFTVKLHNGEMVARARNKIANQFLRSDCTHLLFIDSDIGFHAEDVLAMIAANLYVVGGVYPMKHYRWERIEQQLNEPAQTQKIEVPNLAMDYVWNPVPQSGKVVRSPFIFAETIRQCIEVKEVGTGFLLLKREALEMWAQRYPYYSYLDDFEGNHGVRVTTFFDYGIVNDRYLSEDYWFCSFWREMGGKVWAWPWARLAHAGNHIFQGQFDRRVRPVQEAQKTSAPETETETETAKEK
jgi:hypothetical protein